MKPHDNKYQEQEGKFIVYKRFNLLKKKLIPIRPNRSLPRAAFPRKVKFHHNHKSNC